MSKVAHYLQEHLIGEVMSSADARQYFSTDASILSVPPSIIVYPHNENDVRKTARFTWQLAERGRVIPITPRGLGTDQSGASLGTGIIIVFPAHMNKVLELDPKTGVVAAQAGINYGKLQQALHTHGRFLPPAPSDIESCTLGGALGNNAGGEKSLKYGVIKDFVQGLRVVLANGEVIETGRLNKREASKKMGLNSFEGEIYRAVDKLIEENKELIEKTKLGVTKNAAGYNLADVKHKDGSVDLTPLFVGAQGTLGVITEAILETESYNQNVTLVVALIEDFERASKAVLDLRNLAEKPSAIEMVDSNLLNFIDRHNPNQLKGIIEKPYQKIALLVEFDNANARVQKRLAKKAKHIIEDYGGTCQVEIDPEKQDQLWRIRHMAASVATYAEGNVRALPFIEDAIVPVDKLDQLLSGVYAIFDRYNLEAAVWGHAGDANLSLQPFLDLAQLGDRQKLFRIMDEYYNLVFSLGGSTTGEQGDGRVRGAYLKVLYGEDIYKLFKQLKNIFDPYGILNPGVKLDVTIEQLKPMLRSEYSVGHLYNHMPRA